MKPTWCGSSWTCAGSPSPAPATTSGPPPAAPAVMRIVKCSLGYLITIGFLANLI